MSESADVQGAWFARLMAVNEEGEAEPDEAHMAVVDACMVKKAQVDRMVRALAPQGTRISAAAVHMLAGVADFYVRKALSVRAKKITQLNVAALPPPLRPEGKTKKEERKRKA